MADSQQVPVSLPHDHKPHGNVLQRTRKAALTALAACIMLTAAACGRNEPAPEAPASTPVPTTPWTNGENAPGDTPPTRAIPTLAPTNTPRPVAGLCDRNAAVVRAILETTSANSCRNVRPQDLDAIREISITYGPLKSGDMDGMENLESLEIEELGIPMEEDSLVGLKKLRRLVINTQRPEAGIITESPVVVPGVFRDLGELRELRVLGDIGWIEYDLTQELLQGMPELRIIEMQYLGSIAPNALEDKEKLENVRLHGSKTWSDFPPRIPRGLLAGMPNIRELTISNFRWPPVIDLANMEAACAARDWRGFDQETEKGRRPLGALIVGEETPRDIEGLAGCSEAAN